jgi:hypothetical protein
MRKIFPLGHDDLSVTHDGFKVLRMDQEMDLGFFTEEQIQKWVQQVQEGEALNGPLY